MKLNDRMYQLLQRPMRMLSLRAIVIVAGLSVIAVIILIGTWVWIGITNDQYNQLDRRLDSVSSLGDLSTLLSTAQPSGVPDEPSPEGSLVRTARIAGLTLSVPSDVVLPQLDNGYANTTISGVEYRVRTFSAGRASIALGAPVAETQRRINALHTRVLLICGSLVLATLLVGWLISLMMVTPFRLLAQRARAINAQSKPDEVQVRGVREAVEIGDAVEGMLGRIGDEQQRTSCASMSTTSPAGARPGRATLLVATTLTGTARGDTDAGILGAAATAATAIIVIVVAGIVVVTVATAATATTATTAAAAAAATTTALTATSAFAHGVLLRSTCWLSHIGSHRRRDQRGFRCAPCGRGQ